MNSQEPEIPDEPTDARPVPAHWESSDADFSGDHPKSGTSGMTGDPPEAFGRGVRENAPEAFGRPQSPDADKPADNESDHRDQKEISDAKQGEEKDKPQKPEKKPFYKRPIPLTIIGIIVLIIVIVGVIWWMHERHFEKTDDAFIDGHVIAMSPSVSAIVSDVNITDNERVKKGDLLVKLDPSSFQVIVNQMSANLSAAHQKLKQAQVQLASAHANVQVALAQVSIAQTSALNALQNYDRFAHLSPRARSQQQLDDALAAHKSADAQVRQAQAKLVSARADVSSAGAAVSTALAGIKVAQANLDAAKINLSYCRIFAPEAGMITRKDVEPGSYVQAGQPLFSIVPTNVWVTANFKETKLQRIRIGQPVTISVDAYGGHEFHGKVNSIQNGTGSKFSLMPAENATGNWVKVVQRIPVKITFDPGETSSTKDLLAPGLSVKVKVKVE